MDNHLTPSLMEYSNEQLKEIEYYASIYLKISDIALILRVRPEELRIDIHKEDSPAYNAYHRGKALSNVQLHAQEMTLAKVGSPLALQNARNNLMDMEDDE